CMRLRVAGGVWVAGVFPRAPRHALAGAEIYDPRHDAWEATGNLLQDRAGQGAVKLADGHVLVAGGQTFNALEQAVFLSSAEIYDPETGQWTATGPMNVARTEPMLTLLADGRVFVSGPTPR